jgi:thiol-disulfide isomerase/thioredoxin
MFTSITRVLSLLVGLAILWAVLENGCSWAQQAPASAKDEGETIMMGRITIEELFTQCPIFQERAAGYVPEPATVEKLGKVDVKTEVLLFLGTWCPDSISEAPKIIKVYDTAKNSNLSLQLYGVDRAKQDGLGLTDKYNVTRVPTVIFLREGKELGRIIEYPGKTMEGDALVILTKGQ